LDPNTAAWVLRCSLSFIEIVVTKGVGPRRTSGGDRDLPAG
jgi:hypothetical protein